MLGTRFLYICETQLKHTNKLPCRLGKRQGFIVCHGHLTGRQGFVQPDSEKTPLLFGEAVVRYKGDAQSDGCQIDEKISRAQAYLNCYIFSGSIW